MIMDFNIKTFFSNQNHDVMNPTSDEIKKQNIVDELTWDDSVNANDVTVKVIDGIVELNGSVPTYAAKAAAEEGISIFPVLH